jgi:membrane protein YqaA with SNARE-associated domain
VLVGLQLAGLAPVWLLVAVASLGNTLGTLVNYWLGWKAETAGAHRWLRIPEERFAQAQSWWTRWGLWSLLLSWLPLGDVLTVIAGAMRTPLVVFLALVALAKTGRYIVLALVTAGLVG